VLTRHAGGVFLSTLRNDCSRFYDLLVTARGTSTAQRSESASRRVPNAPAPRRLRERNKQEKLARIERAARLLFTQKGFERTTTREIAQRARVGAGTLFLYAKDKRELLLRMFRADSQRAIAGTCCW
jgi:AcrR family transcriptional regulator